MHGCQCASVPHHGCIVVASLPVSSWKLLDGHGNILTKKIDIGQMLCLIQQPFAQSRICKVSGAIWKAMTGGLCALMEDSSLM